MPVRSFELLPATTNFCYNGDLEIRDLLSKFEYVELETGLILFAVSYRQLKGLLSLANINEEDRRKFVAEMFVTTQKSLQTARIRGFFPQKYLKMRYRCFHGLGLSLAKDSSLTYGLEIRENR